MLMMLLLVQRMSLLIPCQVELYVGETEENKQKSTATLLFISNGDSFSQFSSSPD